MTNGGPDPKRTCAGEARATPSAVGATERAVDQRKGAVGGYAEVDGGATNAQQKQLYMQPMAQQKQMKAMLEHLPTPPVAAASVPTFTPFDPTSELWKDYWAIFDTFAGANSIPNGKKAQVFLTNNKLLDTLMLQQAISKNVNDLTMKEMQGFM